MDLINFDIDKQSELKFHCLIDNEFKIFVCKFDGNYKIGSKGNIDGLFIFSKMVSVYFLFDTISVIVLDLRGLYYMHGNTLLKSLNFFEEIGRDKEEKNKNIILVISQQNSKSIYELLKMKPISTLIVYEDYETAIKKSIILAEKYLLE